MIIALSGLAGTGKDTVADMMRHLFEVEGATFPSKFYTKVALADPLKRIARDVYAFSNEQLWGPSEKRNEPDKRYPRLEHTWPLLAYEATLLPTHCACCGEQFYEEKKHGQCYLTPRYALQKLGSEWGRDCYPNTWVDYAIRCALRLSCNVVIPDIRFKNEVEALRVAGATLVRVKRAGFEQPAFYHPSETEQMEIDDTVFDFVLENDGGLDELRVKVAGMVAAIEAKRVDGERRF